MTKPTKYYVIRGCLTLEEVDGCRAGRGHGGDDLEDAVGQLDESLGAVGAEQLEGLCSRVGEGWLLQPPHQVGHARRCGSSGAANRQ